MEKFFKKLMFHLTGGRPMKFEHWGHDSLPIPIEDGNYYRDGFGRIWMSRSRWSLFRWGPYTF